MRPKPILAVAAGLVLGFLSPLSAQITSGFVSIAPCRLMDTRLASGSGYPPPYGAPSFAPNEKRVVVAAGSIPTNNPCANVIPAFATGIAANFTVTQIGGAGDLRIAPGNQSGSTPLANSILNFNPPMSAIANATSADVDTGGRLTIQTAVQGAAVIVDVFGYYTREGSSINAIVAGKNDGAGNGVLGTTQATDDSAAGVSGHGDNGGYGVYGQSSTNDAVHGESTGGRGVFGTSSTSYGVSGSSSSSDGVHGLGANGVSGVAFGSGAGVKGQNASGTGPGVIGSAAFGGAGVLAQNTGSGGVALRLDNGGIRVTGASPVFAFSTETATLCRDAAGIGDAVIDNVYSNGAPDAFVLPIVVSPNSKTAGVFGVFYSGSNGSGNCPPNRWLMFQAINGEFRDIDDLVRFDILVINR